MTAETAKVLATAGLTLVSELTPTAIEKRYGIDRDTHPETRVGGFYGLHTARN